MKTAKVEAEGSMGENPYWEYETDAIKDQNSTFNFKTGT
jgi:hypothetical protein